MSVENKKRDFVPRVTQLDALEFDGEIQNLLTNQLLDIGIYLKPGVLNNVKPEITLLVHLLIFKYSILKNSASFGQQLLNVKYADKHSTKLSCLFAFLCYGIPYLKEKYDETLVGYSSKRVKLMVDGAEILVKTCNIINLLMFLREGIYPTLTNRLLGMKHVPVSSLSRNVGYSYMTRELLWHGFIELLMFTLPLINYQTLKRHLRSLFSLKSTESSKRQQVVNFNVETKCAVCQETPIMPCRISQFCPHLSCYYCIKGNVLADKKFTCPLCNEVNTAIEHLQFIQC